MTPQQFVAKWKRSTLKERSASQSHFNDLCELLGEPKPTDADPHGDWYCFERGAKKTGGGDGWADVWKRHCFGWEYKGKRKDLDEALMQLQRYSIALENPPLLIVCDLENIVIHTNWTNCVNESIAFDLDDLLKPDALRVLKWAFSEPERLKPKKTTAAITEEAAAKFARLAQRLRDRGQAPDAVAHFLNRVLFCLFAEDVGLLPNDIVSRIMLTCRANPARSDMLLAQLFGTMSTGGAFGTEIIDWFNGGLFENGDAIRLEADEVEELLAAAQLDWSSVEPSIIGTLFERGLDPSKRSQLGAHYTDPETILRLITPVVVEPLMREWRDAKERVAGFLKSMAKASSEKAKKLNAGKALRAHQEFLDRLAGFRILDPACGSGNFLYLSLQALKDIEHVANLEAEELGLPMAFMGMNTGVHNLHGIEINPYAAELARVTVWIGEIQWMLRHGAQPSRQPILKPLDTIECRDAVLNDDGSEATWPRADCIVGNPPFLGDKKMREGLGHAYTEALRKCYAGRVPGGADFVTFWFEKARAQLERREASRVGLVSTNSIRGGASRRVLDRVVATAPIFSAWGDLPWVNEGAAVRVSLICFGDGEGPYLNGAPVMNINTDLTAGDVDATKAVRLNENKNCCFYATVKAGAFDVSGAIARTWLKQPNPHGKANSDVVKPWVNAMEITRRSTDKWVVDFGVNMSESDAALYEAPFAHVLDNVKPERDKTRREQYRKYWWLFAEPIPGMRKALKPLSRYLATPAVAKHRLFVWLPACVVPDHAVVVVAREDDTSFGVLHSRMHEVWALRLGTSLEDRPRYTPTTTFETFPFPPGLTPDVTAEEYASQPHAQRIAEAARQLDRRRQAWLNPPEWSDVVAGESGSTDRVVAKPGHEKDLAVRTLTNLYNAKPSWLRLAHDALDKAVAEAYGWHDYSPSMSDEEIMRRLLKLNQARSATNSE
jgi:type II restriction/modification system DNA methylase subunit YeeA